MFSSSCPGDLEGRHQVGRRIYGSGVQGRGPGWRWELRSHEQVGSLWSCKSGEHDTWELEGSLVAAWFKLVIFFFFFFNIYLFLGEYSRGGAESGEDRLSKAGSTLTVASLMQGLNSRTTRS